MNKFDPRLAYREAVVSSATPLQLTVMLYEIAIADIRNAIDALKRNDIEGRAKNIQHCLLVLQELQGRLDFERGGDTAKSLDRFYSHIRGKLLEAQIKQSAEILEQQISLLAGVRDAWQQISGGQISTGQAAEPGQAEVNPALTSRLSPPTAEAEHSANWSA